MEMLPMKWAIRRTPATAKEINDYFNSKLPENAYYSGTEAYLHYPNTKDGVGFMIGEHFEWELKNGYTLITIEDFRKHVLKVQSFVLPKKWYIERNKENYDVINKYVSKMCGVDYYYTCQDGYVIYPSSKCGHPWHGTENSTFKEPIGLPKITFEQFKKYVMGEDQVGDAIGWSNRTYANDQFYMDDVSMAGRTEDVRAHAKLLEINKYGYSFNGTGPYWYNPELGRIEVCGDSKVVGKVRITAAEFLTLRREFFLNNKTKTDELQTASQSVTGGKGPCQIRPYSGKGTIASSSGLVGNKIGFGQIKGAIVKSPIKFMGIQPF